MWEPDRFCSISEKWDCITITTNSILNYVQKIVQCSAILKQCRLSYLGTTLQTSTCVCWTQFQIVWTENQVFCQYKYVILKLDLLLGIVYTFCSFYNFT